MKRVRFLKFSLWAGLVATTATSFGQTVNYYNLIPPAQQVPMRIASYAQPEEAPLPATSPSDVANTPSALSDAAVQSPYVHALPAPCAAQCSALTYGGWLSAGVYGNAWGDRTGNGPIGFRDHYGGTVDQLWFYLDKKAESRCGSWDWGFRMDFLFGADAPDTQTFGTAGGNSGVVGAGAWDNEWISSDDGVYGFAMPQLYGELAIGNLSVKLGHFYTLIGYEVVAAPDNFFYSHATTMYFGEPFTHTGALATYALSDDIELYGGWVNGWDQGWLNPTGASQVIGGTSIALTRDITFTYAFTAGDSGRGWIEGERFGSGDMFVNSLVFDVALTQNLNYVFQHDLGSMNGWVNAPGQGDTITNSQWFGINQYLFYTINDCWKAGMRVEWFCDDDGVRVGHGAASYTNLTLGLNYKPRANVTLRPEIRWDNATGLAGNNPLPFSDGTKNHQFSGGFDVIVTF